MAKVHAHIANGANPALVAPSINSANAILKERRARKNLGFAMNGAKILRLAMR